MLPFLRGRRTDTRPEENPGLWRHFALLSSSGFLRRGQESLEDPEGEERAGVPLLIPGWERPAGSGKPRGGAGGSDVPGLSPAFRGRSLPGAAPPPARRPHLDGPAPVPGTRMDCAGSPKGTRGLSRRRAPSRAEPQPSHGGAARSARGVRAALAAAAGRRSRRGSGARSPATPGTRDGGAAVQRPPAAGRLRAGEVTPRAKRAGRIRGGRGGPGSRTALRGRGGAGPTTLVPLTASTFNFLEPGSDAAHPSVGWGMQAGAVQSVRCCVAPGSRSEKRSLNLLSPGSDLDYTPDDTWPKWLQLQGFFKRCLQSLSNFAYFSLAVSSYLQSPAGRCRCPDRLPPPSQLRTVSPPHHSGLMRLPVQLISGSLLRFRTPFYP